MMSMVGVVLLVAWIGSRLMKSLLFGLSPHDRRTIAVAVCAVLSVILVAGALPATRASIR